MTNYACPMHPDVQSDRPGNCSKCGMKLEQREDTRSTTSAKKKSEPVRERK